MPPWRCHALGSSVSAPSIIDPVAISKVILTSESPSALGEALLSPEIQWTPLLVNSVLKSLWSHAPKALLFFRILSHHPYYAHHQSSFDHAIDLSSRLRDFNSTWALLHQMRSLGIGPSHKTFAIITERYVAAGKPHRALKVFLSMHKHGCLQDLNSFNTLLDVLCKARRVEMASIVFRSISAAIRPDVVTHNILANGWCLTKQVPRALEVLKQMVEKGLSPNLSSYNIILKGYVRAGQADAAWKFFLEMKRRNCAVDVITYTTLVHGLGVLGQVKKATKVFKKMAEEGVMPSVATYNALIQVLCKNGRLGDAMVAFEQMLQKGCEPNVMTYNMVIRGLCHADKMEIAMDYMGRMKKENLKPDVQTYNLVIRFFCKAGEIDEAMDLFRGMSIEGCLPNLDTYNVLISGMFLRKKSDDLVVAGQLLVEMIDRGFLPTKFTFERILNGLLITGNQKFAKEILTLQSRFGHLPRQFRL